MASHYGSMASTPTARIEEQQSAGDSGSSIVSPTNKWLHYVDMQLAQNDLPILKLCLYPHLSECWKRASKADSPSQLFHHLQQTLSEDDDSQQYILHAFLCALRVLGGRHRGILCIAKLQEYGLNKPQNQKESKEFRFFQCYARVARGLVEESGAEEKIRKAYDAKLEKNYRNIPHIADLFIELYQAQLVGPDNCTGFHKELQRCEEGEKYIRVMKKYTTFGDMSTGDMWSVTSSEPSTLNPSNSFEVLNSRHIEEDSTLLVMRKPINTEVRSQQKRRIKFCIALVILVIIIAIIIIGLCGSIYFLIKCHPTNQDDIMYKAKENNTVIIANVVPAITSKLSVTENVLHQKSLHEVHLFLAEYGCNQLPTQMNVSECYSGDQLANLTAVYLMPSSTINYTITASTSESTPGPVNIEVFIVKGLNHITHFYPNKGYPFFKVPIGYKVNTTTVFYSIDSPDFYAVFFLIPPNVPLNVSFNSTLQSRIIDISKLRYIYNYTLPSEDNKWIHSLRWERCSHRKCLIAEIAPQNNSINQFISLDVNFTQRQSYMPFISAVLGLILVALLLYCCKTIKKIRDIQTVSRI